MGIFDKFKIKVNGLSSTFPINLDQISTKLWQKINIEWDFEDPLLLFCLMSDRSYEEICNQKIEDVSYENIIKLTRWFFRYVIIDEEGNKCLGFPNVPTPTQILGVDVPKLEGKKTSTMSQVTVGQAFLNDKIYSKNKNIQTSIAVLVANVLQPIIDKEKWSAEKVYELEKRIENLPITETFPLAVFFCTKFQNFVIYGLQY